MENEMHDRQFEILAEEHDQSFWEYSQVEAILEEAANWNLREEVYEEAQLYLENDHSINVIEAYQLAFEEYQRK